jgi:hypothetical protein
VIRSKGDCRTLQSEEFYNLCASTGIIGVRQCGLKEEKNTHKDFADKTLHLGPDGRIIIKWMSRTCMEGNAFG